MAFLLKYKLHEGRNQSTCAPDRSYSDQRHGLANGRSLPTYTMIKSSCFVCSTKSLSLACNRNEPRCYSAISIDWTNFRGRITNATPNEPPRARIARKTDIEVVMQLVMALLASTSSHSEWFLWKLVERNGFVYCVLLLALERRRTRWREAVDHIDTSHRPPEISL